MEFKKPKSKKKFVPPAKLRLPLKIKEEIIGLFNGEFVAVHDLDSMLYLHEAGNFGKGNLSKAEPNHSIRKDDIPKVLLKHQFENQEKWNSSTNDKKNIMILRPGKTDLKLSLQSINCLLQASSTDDNRESWKSWKEKQKFQDLNIKNYFPKKDFFLEFKKDDDYNKDDYFINLVEDILKLKKLKNPKISSEKSEEIMIVNTGFNPLLSELTPVNINAQLDNLFYPKVENLNLNLEESFFLRYVLGCLNILDMNLSEIGILDLWQKFNAVKENFTERYITYHYYRTKGWIIKSGLKFGGDFLLYKNGPAYHHASYLVKTVDKRKKLTWREFLAMSRLVETFNKDLLLSNVKSIVSLEKKHFPDVFSNSAVQEILVRRWFPSKERFSKADEITS